MKRHRRTSWTTELHTYNTQATKEESIIDFLHKVEVAKAFLKQVNDTVHIEMLDEMVSNIKKKFPKLNITENPYISGIHPEEKTEEKCKYAASSYYRMGLLALERETGYRIKDFSDKLELTTF